MSLDYSYVCAYLKNEYQEEIFSLLLAAGIAPPKFDFHVTIMWDEREIEEPLAKLNPLKEYRAKVTSLDMLGDGLVFHLNSSDFTEEFRRLKEAGYEHSFKTPLHHMSLAYDLGDYELLALKAAFADYGGRELVFNKTSFGEKKE